MPPSYSSDPARPSSARPSRTNPGGSAEVDEQPVVEVVLVDRTLVDLAGCGAGGRSARAREAADPGAVAVAVPGHQQPVGPTAVGVVDRPDPLEDVALLGLPLGGKERLRGDEAAEPLAVELLPVLDDALLARREQLGVGDRVLAD